MLYVGDKSFNYSDKRHTSLIDMLLAMTTAERIDSIRSLDKRLASAIVDCLVARWTELALCYVHADRDPSCLDDLMLGIINSSDNVYEVLTRADALLDDVKANGVK